MTDLPLTRDQVARGNAWLLSNFGTKLAAATQGKPYDVPILAAIACKETGYLWIGRTQRYRPDELLALMIGDPLGDYPGSKRKAYPQNGTVFRADYGDAFADDLIAEANKARAMQGWTPRQYLYNGYGLFQYDLQHVRRDRAFFEQHLWYDIDSCLQRVVSELDRKMRDSGGDLRDGVRRYNGAGAKAEAYADHVMTFAEWCRGG